MESWTGGKYLVLPGLIELITLGKQVTYLKIDASGPSVYLIPQAEMINGPEPTFTLAAALSLSRLWQANPSHCPSLGSTTARGPSASRHRNMGSFDRSANLPITLPRSTMVPITLSVVTTLLATCRALQIHNAQESLNVPYLNPVCPEIARSVSLASKVYYPGSTQYLRDIAHSSSSSSALSVCSVEPGTAEDVAIILRILGSTRTSFAVKGGGHASNPGFSSTTGVHIAMSRFSAVTYDPAERTATIGAGLIWDDVYAALEPYGVNVVGGRVSGVGVAGFTLGGGYSWLSNQHGLTIDTVVRYQLVTPNGDIVTVTESSKPDLFFALKGGFNNFGIVTQFTLRTFPQTLVWGGFLTYTARNLDAVSAAVAKFCARVTDPKAAIITAYNFAFGQPGISQLVFYDAPMPPPGVFDDFLSIPHLTKDVKMRSFLSLVQVAPVSVTYGSRGIFNSVSLLYYSESMLSTIVNETIYWGSRMSKISGILVSYDVEPFLPTVFSHTNSSTAYPPSRGRGLLPLIIYYAWTAPFMDSEFHDAIRQSAAFLVGRASAEDQDIECAPLYGNYAIYDTPVERLYGDNMPRLRRIKAAVDPDNIMGLAGGWKI